MPQGNAAKIIARDARKNASKRRQKVKTKANKHANQHEFLRQSSRKQLQSKYDENDLLLYSDGSDVSFMEDQEETVTSTIYSTLMNDKDFLLSFQPKKLEEHSDDEIETLGEQKIGQLNTGLEASEVNLSQSQNITDLQKSVSGKNKSKKLHLEEQALEDSIRFRWYIIPKRSNFRNYWDYIVMTLAIYNCLWTPLTISFDWAIYKDENDIALVVISTIVLILYVCDIVIQFLTSYYNVQTGDEITQPSLIAKRYIFGEFYIDFMSTFPFSNFNKDNQSYQVFAQICQLLKVLRIRKMYSAISQANLTVETKALTKIAFYSFLLFIYTHIVGCVMWFFLKTENQWVAPTDFGVIRSRLQDPWQLTGDQPVAVFDYREDFDLFMFQWFSMWYHSALSLMLVEITARSMSQLGAMVMIYIVNAIFNAILFGIYFDLLEAARARQNEFQTEIDNANTAMGNLALPDKIKEQVRNYILQTHETKTQQSEFVSFTESMPPSKNLVLNALNFKKALNLSPAMIGLRLGMREQYRKRLRNLTIQDLNNPNLDKADPYAGDKEFKKLLMKIVFALSIKQVQPEEIIIMQSEPIQDQDGEYDPEKAFFYIILNGNFKVSSLRFNHKKQKKKPDYQPSEDMLHGSEAPHRSMAKKLISGDYFGEVSFIFNCRRTSTIKAKLYATLGCIDHTTMLDLLRDFPEFKALLKSDVVKLYDDDLKLFLVAALRRVDYIANASEEVLTTLAYVCNAEIKEKGFVLYNMDEDPDEQINDELIIIFDGAVELYVTMDTGTELQLEVLPTGSIINAHNMLAKRKHSVNVRFTMNTTFYYLKYTKIVEVARKFPSFGIELLRQKGRADANKARDADPIDYIRGYHMFQDVHQKNYDGVEAEKIFKILNAFKNSVLYNLLKNRKDRKVKNLKKILEEYIAKKNKQKELQRIKKRELDLLPLGQRLEKLVDDDKVLTDIQYENVRESMEVIVKESIEQNFTQLRLLKANFMDRLLKKGGSDKDHVDYKKVQF